MAPLAVGWCRNLVIQHGVAPDGGTEVKRGENVAEIKQIGSELKGNEGERLGGGGGVEVIPAKPGLPEGATLTSESSSSSFFRRSLRFLQKRLFTRHYSLIVVISWLQKS